ncbi:MAG: NAD(P)-dependent oxidoreductase [Candidatus Woesearchaeota archaeon]|nr:NAD(P)-dependent oxidoreductase [Candidatus Woesearchaeota archaeon]
MKIVIPGGAGFFGRNFVRVWKEEGRDPAELVVIDKDDQGVSYVKEFGTKIVLADLSEKGDWEKEFEKQEIVLCLNAQISGKTRDVFEKNNIDAVKNVISATKKAGINKILHFSSAAVLSVRKDDYAATKEEGQKLIEQSGLQYAILQPSIMYGLTDSKNIGWLISFARKCPVFPIPGSGKYPRQPIFVDDVCRLVIKMLDNMPENKVYSINGKTTIYFKDMIKSVLHAMGGFRFAMHIPVWAFKLCMVIGNKVMKNAPFTPDQLDSLTSGDVFPDYPWWDEFDIKVTPFDEGIKRMLEENNTK